MADAKSSTSDERNSRYDIAKNRQSKKWTKQEIGGRILWTLASPLFQFSPRTLWGWRRLLLRLFGAKVGREAQINPSVRISIPWNLTVGDYAAVGDGAILYALGPIRLGDRVTVSQGAHLCAGTHDYRDPSMPLLKPPISVADDVWICAEAFVGPGVSVGERAVVGARAVVVKDVPADAIVAGNPAKVLRWRYEGSKVENA